MSKPLTDSPSGSAVTPERRPPSRPATFPKRTTKRVVDVIGEQLRAIEKISTLLIESRVDDINQIRRSEVEPSNGPDTLDVPIVNDPKALYQTLPFEFQFHCTPEALRSFLNSLTKSDWFFAVRKVQLIGEPPLPGEGGHWNTRRGRGAGGRGAVKTHALRCDRACRSDRILRQADRQGRNREAGCVIGEG